MTEPLSTVKRIYLTLCQHCVWTIHPHMLTGYCVRFVTCHRCKYLSDCALTYVLEEEKAAL